MPLAEIDSATLPYVGGAWPVVRLALTGGRRVQFLVDRTNAERFVDALSA